VPDHHLVVARLTADGPKIDTGQLDEKQAATLTRNGAR
jgi:hypothetical protein